MQPANTFQRNSDLERTLVELARSRIEDLRQKWFQLFSAPPPMAFGPDLMRRSVAQRLQEDANGKLSPGTQRELNRIIMSIERNPIARIQLPRRIKPGAVLVREWKAKTHHVTVLDKGFTYEGRPYPSLSEIAREITGTRWNGPKFFGLRPTVQSDNDQPTNQPPPRRGRPPKPANTARQPNTAEVTDDL